MRLLRFAVVGLLLTGPAWAQQRPAEPAARTIVDATGWRRADPHVWEFAASPAAWSRVWRRVDAQNWMLRRSEPAHT